MGPAPRKELRVAPQDNIGTTPGHVRGDSHGTVPARLCNDLRLPLVVLGVEHMMGDTIPLEHAGKQFGAFDGGGSHQHRLPPLVAVSDLHHNPVVFLLGRAIDEVGMILPDHGHVGGDHHHIQVVGLFKLGSFCVRSTCHSSQLVVHPEIVLEGNGCQGLVLALDLDPLLGLQGLVETVGITAPGHKATGKLVHYDDLVVLDHVIHVLLEQAVGFKPLLDMVVDLDMAGIVQVVHTQQFFYPLHTLFREHDAAGFLVPGKVKFLFKPGDNRVDGVVLVGGIVRLARDNEGGPRFVDEDTVHLIHDGVVHIPLDIIFQGKLHIVSKVVEPELVVCTVGDSASIGVLSFQVPHGVLDNPDFNTQEAVDDTHPL